MVGSIVASRLRNTPLFALAWPWPPMCAFNTGFTTNCFYDYEIRKTNSTLKNKHLKYHTALSIFIILCKHYGISYCVLSWAQASLWIVVSRFLMHCWFHYSDLPVLLGRLVWPTDAAGAETDPVSAIFYSQGTYYRETHFNHNYVVPFTCWCLHTLYTCRNVMNMKMNKCRGMNVMARIGGARVQICTWANPVVISGTYFTGATAPW
jgi:hypothetical protein